MNCPNCNGEMILGYVQSRSGIIWSVKVHEWLMLPNAKKGDVWVGGKDNCFSVLTEALRCPECETIVVLPPIEKT